MSDVDTGGGAHVGGFASAGRDFTGRDSHKDGFTGNRVEITQAQARQSADDFTNTELLQRVWHEMGEVRMALLGDPYNRGNPGLVDMVERLAEKQAHANGERREISEKQIASTVLAEERYRKITSQQSAFMIVMWATLALVGFEGIAIIVLFIQRAGEMR